jgi:NAD(P)-dependent dehydrogenase (short-subunit alcohol dehydrogenase family)
MKAPVVVIDAASDVGRGVVEAALAAARPVVAVSAAADELAHLREHFSDAHLTTLAGSIATEAEAAMLAAALRDLDRPIAGVVIANAAQPLRGRVLDHAAAAIQGQLERELLPQLAAARALIPLLLGARRNGGYVVIGKPGGEQPWAGYGAYSIAVAAAGMLVRALHDEARLLGVRVQLLAIPRPVRTARNCERACAGWPDALAIGEQALALIDRRHARHADAAVVPFAFGSASDSIAVDAGVHMPAPPASPTPAPSPPPSDIASQQVVEQTWRALEPIFVSIKNAADGR